MTVCDHNKSINICVCDQCLSPLKLVALVRIPIKASFIHKIWSFNYGRSVVFSTFHGISNITDALLKVALKTIIPFHQIVMRYSGDNNVPVIFNITDYKLVYKAMYLLMPVLS